MCGVSAHSRQLNSPHYAHSQTTGFLHSLYTGATCSLDVHTIPSAIQPPSPRHQGLGCYPGFGAPLDDPLDIAPVYWQHFVLHQGIPPTIADLYTKSPTMLWMGLEESAVVQGAISCAGTLELWLHMLPYLFSLSNT